MPELTDDDAIRALVGRLARRDPSGRPPRYVLPAAALA
jgi:hypothetical protein